MPARDSRAPTGPFSACRDAFARTFGAAPGTTVSAPHIRTASSVDRVLLQFVIASLPALLIGAWSAGSVAVATIVAGGPASDSLLYRVLVDVSMLEIGQLPGMAPAIVGIAMFLPVLLTAMVTSLFWAWVFAAGRQRPIDAGWLMTAWLFALLLPPTAPLYLVAIGLSFGAVIGLHIFGGTGHYLVSPALLGAVMLQVAYPDALLGQGLGSSDDFMSTWALATGQAGGGSVLPAAWLPIFLGRETGAFGTPSALACFLGAAYLCFRRIASARVVASAVLAAIVAALLLDALVGETQALALPWHAHLSIGNFAFAVAFLATDPSTNPTTRAGRWIYGVLVGGLTVLIRLLGNTHPEGTLTAVLLCALTIPLIDHILVHRYVRQRRRARGLA